MNCQEFQEVLPYIIERGGNAEQEEHLRTCRSCAELVQELNYIAEQARLLLPMYDPSPRVWTGIEHALHREGLLQEGRSSRQGHTTTYPTQARNWTPIGWAMALASLIVFTYVLINYHPRLPASQPMAQNSSAPAAQFEGEDQRLMSQMASQSPEAARAYEAGLREANAYIEDAQQAVNRNPADVQAHEQLQQAYQQKETLYQMATTRSLP
jgi:hypothetical protein